MSSNSRQVLTLEASKKRKEREGFDTPNASTKVEAEAEPTSNQVLAGYLAHEFLTQGTLLGQRWEPAGADSVSTAAPLKPQAYADVANLLKTDGAHVPGIVNPTQLARWIQM